MEEKRKRRNRHSSTVSVSASRSVSQTANKRFRNVLPPLCNFTQGAKNWEGESGFRLNLEQVRASGLRGNTPGSRVGLVLPPSSNHHYVTIININNKTKRIPQRSTRQWKSEHRYVDRTFLYSVIHLTFQCEVRGSHDSILRQKNDKMSSTVHGLDEKTNKKKPDPFPVLFVSPLWNNQKCRVRTITNQSSLFLSTNSEQ